MAMNDLTVTKTGKYLGVVISEDLSWKVHVDATTKKANNSLAFLRQNLSSCPQEANAQCYKTLVRPIIDYAASERDPHTTSCIQQLEAVQRRAARFVKGDYHTTRSTAQLIQDLNWPPLQQRRQNAKLVMMYRITYGLVDIPASLHPTGTYTREHSLRYLVQYCRTESACTPSSRRASEFRTTYQSTSPCLRPLRASRGVWQVFISLYRTVFRDFNLHRLFYRHLFAPHHNLVNSPSTTMLQSWPCTVREEEEGEGGGFIYADGIVLLSGSWAGLQEKLDGLHKFWEHKCFDARTSKKTYLIFNETET